MTEITVRWLVPPGPAPAAVLGVPGATWPQQLYAAGLIAEPTVEAANAYLISGWQTVSVDTVATPGQLLSVDTTASPVNITLPAGGGPVALRDNGGTWATNNVIVHGNGATIQGGATFVLDATGYRIDFNLAAGVWRYALSYQYGGA